MHRGCVLAGTAHGCAVTALPMHFSYGSGDFSLGADNVCYGIGEVDSLHLCI